MYRKWTLAVIAVVTTSAVWLLLYQEPSVRNPKVVSSGPFDSADTEKSKKIRLQQRAVKPQKPEPKSVRKAVFEQTDHTENELRNLPPKDKTVEQKKLSVAVSAAEELEKLFPHKDPQRALEDIFQRVIEIDPKVDGKTWELGTNKEGHDVFAFESDMGGRVYQWSDKDGQLLVEEFKLENIATIVRSYDAKHKRYIRIEEGGYTINFWRDQDGRLISSRLEGPSGPLFTKTYTSSY